MKILYIYMFSLEYEGHTNGVDRHIATLMDELGRQTNIKCYHFAFTSNQNLLYPRECPIKSNCVKIYIPLPRIPNEVFNEPHALLAYNREVCDLVKGYFTKRARRILHVHTLNMMPLALLIKKKFKCSIVSHIHSLSWKYNIDRNPGKFIYQWRKQCLMEYDDKEQMLSVLGEWDAYKKADHVVCVTKCGEHFVKYMQNGDGPEISVIPNGLHDVFGQRKVERSISEDGHCQILFAGGGSRTKGLSFLLDAIRLLPEQYKGRIKILVAGVCDGELREVLVKRNQGINITFAGHLSQDELYEAYCHADIGAILSLHEQCSYAAIEMMMHQLPIVSTGVDGLGEMFQNGYNALLVPVEFDTGKNIVCPQIEVLSQKLLFLINNSEDRKAIGMNARLTFLKHYTAECMTERILTLYNKLC